MTNRRLGQAGTMLLGLATATLAGVADANACGGEWIPALEMMKPQVDYRPQGVARAEHDLERGDYRAAAGAIIRMMPHIRSLKAKDSASIVARAQRVLAVATARSGGALDVEREVPKFVQDTWLGKSAEDKQSNLRFAVAVLERASKLEPGDPAAQTELAEALARLDERRGEARQLLEKLAKKDLIATPEGYAALASLRQSGGDTQGQLAALKRCQAMSQNPAICGARVEASAKS